jgi:hypothetical protein
MGAPAGPNASLLAHRVGSGTRPHSRADVAVASIRSLARTLTPRKHAEAAAS